MSRKSLANDFEKRWVFTFQSLAKCGQRVSDLADVTSAGKLFQIHGGHGAITAKARLATDDSVTVSTTGRLVPAEKQLTARQISDVIEWSEYCGMSPYKTVCRDGDPELNSLWHAQPVETD